MTFNFYNEQDVAYIKKAFAGRTIGLTSGAFDMYHVLHDDYLQRCRRHCGHDGVLIVGVDSNDLLSERKGPKRPIIPETDRLQLVSGRNGVDAAFALPSGPTSLEQACSDAPRLLRERAVDIARVWRVAAAR